jgi:hypothetical protein
MKTISDIFQNPKDFYIGKPALLNKKLIVIHSIETEVITVTRKRNFFSMATLTTQKEVVKAIWWKTPGLGSDNVLTSSALCTYYLWDEMVVDAELLIQQINYFKNNP